MATLDGVLITGSSGFLGGHVLRRLAMAPGLTPIPTTRDGRGGTRRLDLRAPGADALAGAHAVVHCAVGDRAVTVEGTRALLAAAAAAGVKRFVHISSVAVYGAVEGAVTEGGALVSPAGEGYAAWKSAAEQACLAQPGLEVVRLRPAIIYGPGGTLWVSALARRIRAGRWGTFGRAGEGICSPVHARDVAEAVAAALTHPAAPGRAFNVSGPETLTWNVYFTRLATAIGAPPLRAVAPAMWRARSLAGLPLKAAARLRPGLFARAILGAPAASELALFRLRATYPAEAAGSIGWAASTPLAAGLAECADWLRGEGLAA